MQSVAATCPKCSGALQIPSGLSVVKCIHCGVDVVTEGKEGASGPSASNPLEAAETAFAAGNYREAFDRYGAVLALDPSNAHAWLMKGLSAGRQSDVDGSRIAEMTGLVTKAIDMTAGPERNALRKLGSTGINSVGLALQGRARERLTGSAAPDKAWAEYLATCRLLLLGYESAHFLDPKNREVMESAVALAVSCLEGVEYTDKRHTKSIRRHVVPEQRAEELRTIVGRYTAKIRKLDPTYSAHISVKAEKAPSSRTLQIVVLGALILFYVVFVAVKCS